MAVYGYARVSTQDQNTAAQIAAFRRAGITRIVEEKRSAAKDRPELARLLSVLRAGDVLVVYKLDRLARSVSHFTKVFEELNRRQVGFRSLTESIETDTAQGRMFLHMLSAFAEFERELIRERCIAGQIAAVARGSRNGRPALLNQAQVSDVLRMLRQGEKKARIARAMGVGWHVIDRIARLEANPLDKKYGPRRPVIGPMIDQVK